MASLEEHLKSLNDASAKCSALWTTFVTLELYLAITFGSITHRALLLEEPVTLPLLNALLPLTGFFFVAPMLLVIFHFYILLQLKGLSLNVMNLEHKLSKLELEEEQSARQRLDGFF